MKVKAIKEQVKAKNITPRDGLTLLLDKAKASGEMSIIQDSKTFHWLKNKMQKKH